MSFDSLKLLDPSAPLDFLVGYITDTTPLWKAQVEWVGAHHRDGEAFAAQLVGRGAELLADATAASREKGEALAATAAQQESTTKAMALARRVRRIGRFVASELKHEGELDAARVVSANLGVGFHGNLTRQSTLRRLLSLQRAGLKETAELLAPWKVPDLAGAVGEAVDDVQRCIETQSKEQVEADLARDRLARSLERAVSLFNRALRLVNAWAEEAPAELLAGLARVQGDNSGAFRSYKSQAASAQPASPETEADPV